MTMHRSLSSRGKGKKNRSVLKRYERLKELQEKEKWKEGNSVFGLPKLKTVRWKIKKVKKAEAEVASEEAKEAPAEVKAEKEKS